MDEVEVSARIATLERAVRQLRVALALVGLVTAGLIGALVVGVTSPRRGGAGVRSADRVTAHEFIVTDQAGNIAGWLGVVPGAGSGLVLVATNTESGASEPGYFTKMLDAVKAGNGEVLFADSAGTEFSLNEVQAGKSERAVLSTTIDGSELQLFGKNGLSSVLSVNDLEEVPEYASLMLSQAEPAGAPIQAVHQAEMSLASDGSADLGFGMTVGRDFAKFQVDKRGIPSLNYYDESGDGRASLRLTPTGDPSISLWGKGDKTYGALNLDYKGFSISDDQSQSRIALRLKSAGDPIFALWGKGAKTYGGTYLDEKSLTIADDQGNSRATLGAVQLEKTRTGATETTAASSLVLFDKKGDVIWRAPAE
jgi:hypothetical protein